MVARPDGTAQLTYNTWPLYTFVQDTGPGVASGQGVNHFFAATPSLTASTGLPAATTQPTPAPRPTPRAMPCTIPQHGGGDGDSDNFGAPSDGDGCDR